MAKSDPLLLFPDTSRAVAASCMHAVSGRRELKLSEIMDHVINDYGTVSTRTVNRVLAKLVEYGVLKRVGKSSAYVYSRSK